jgi:hypothetical protein
MGEGILSQDVKMRLKDKSITKGQAVCKRGERIMVKNI